MATLNTNTVSTLSNNIMVWIDKVTLEMLVPALVFEKLTVKRQVPINSGKTATWIRYTRFTGNTTSVTGDSVPNGKALTSSQVTVALGTYGEYSPIDTFLFLTSRDDVIKSAMKILTLEAGDTIDLLIRNAITAGATNQFANGKTALSQIAVGDILKMNDIRKVRRGLKENNVPTFSDGNYRGVMHPRQSYDITSETTTGGWTDVHKYTDAGFPMIMNAEIGKVEQIRWMETSNVFSTTTGTSASNKAYYAAIAGDESVATVDLETGMGKPQFDILKPRESGINDPLGQYYVAAFKIEAFAAKVLEQARCYNLISAATQV